MRNKHIIKVDWHPAEPVNVDVEECLKLAQRAEDLDNREWAEHWLNQAILEERKLTERLEVRV